MDPLEGLKRSFGTPLPTPRLITGDSHPTKCNTFLAHGNEERNPSCVRCGKLRGEHV